MATIPASRTSPAVFATGALVAGALVAVVLGVYGSVHQPTGETITTLEFGSMIAMKVWLAAAAGVLGLGQLVGALALYGKLGVHPPAWLGAAHLTTKVLVLHGRAAPGWMLPLAGGLLISVLVVTVSSSAVWYLAEFGTPSGYH